MYTFFQYQLLEQFNVIYDAAVLRRRLLYTSLIWSKMNEMYFNTEANNQLEWAKNLIGNIEIPESLTVKPI